MSRSSFLSLSLSYFFSLVPLSSSLSFLFLFGRLVASLSWFFSLPILIKIFIFYQFFFAFHSPHHSPNHTLTMKCIRAFLTVGSRRFTNLDSKLYIDLLFFFLRDDGLLRHFLRTTLICENFHETYL